VQHQSSSSHPNDTNKVAYLGDLTCGQVTFAGGEVVLESDGCVSTVGKLGSETKGALSDPTHMLYNTVK